jgi:hypothetical protein
MHPVTTGGRILWFQTERMASRWQYMSQTAEKGQSYSINILLEANNVSL